MFGSWLSRLARVAAQVVTGIAAMAILLSAPVNAQGVVGTWTASGVSVTFQPDGRWLASGIGLTAGAACGASVSMGGPYTLTSGSLSMSLDSSTCAGQTVVFTPLPIASGSYSLCGSTLAAHLQGLYGPGDLTLYATGSASRPTPSGLSVTAPATLQSSGRVTLGVTATYLDGASRAISALWSSSDPSVATVSSSGVLTASSVTVDTPVTLTATYTENCTTVTSSKTLVISAAPAALVSIAVFGGSSVQSGGQMLLKVTATYGDGSSRQVVPSGWALSDPALGSVNSRGVLAVGSVTVTTPLTVTANYTEAGLTGSASVTVSISAIPPVLSNLILIGAQGTLTAGEPLNLAAEGRYSDGSRKPVTASWKTSNPGVASITPGGVLTAATVAQDTPVLITADYSEGGVAVSAVYQTLVLAAAIAPPTFQTEVEVAGTPTAYTLAVWFNTGAKSTGNPPGTFAATQTYKLYVAAVVPVGPVLSEPMLFLLNRSNEWQALSFPLAEYLSAVAQDDWHLIELLNDLDISLFSGTVVYAGYGTSDTEMLAAGRYKVVYQVP